MNAADVGSSPMHDGVTRRANDAGRRLSPSFLAFIASRTRERMAAAEGAGSQDHSVDPAAVTWQFEVAA
jgi:hypothetical protein